MPAVATLGDLCLAALARMIAGPTHDDGESCSHAVVWQCGALAALPASLLQRLLMRLRVLSGGQALARPVLSLLYHSALESLDLRGCGSWLDDSAAAELRPVHLPALRELRVNHAPAMTPRGLAHIVTLRSLRLLELECCTGLAPTRAGAAPSIELLTAPGRLPQLEELSLMECALVIPAPSGLSRLGTLTRLELGGNDVATGALAGLAPTLCSLSVWGSTSLASADAASLATELPQLRRLDLRMTGVSATETTPLLLGALPELRELLLDHTPGPAPAWFASNDCSGGVAGGMAGLASSGVLQRLEVFGFAYVPGFRAHSRSFARAVDELALASRLAELSLSGLQAVVNDAALAALFSGGRGGCCGTLRKLELARTAVSWEAPELLALTGAGELRVLSELDLSGCATLRDRGLRNLGAAVPQLATLSVAHTGVTHCALHSFARLRTAFGFRAAVKVHATPWEEGVERGDEALAEDEVARAAVVAFDPFDPWVDTDGGATDPSATPSHNAGRAATAAAEEEWGGEGALHCTPPGKCVGSSIVLLDAPDGRNGGSGSAQCSYSPAALLFLRQSAFCQEGRQADVLRLPAFLRRDR